MINLIPALINTRLTEFRSEIITMINKNGDQLMSLEDKGSYYKDFETIIYPKEKKRKAGDIHSDDVTTLFKNNTENNNGAVVGQQNTILKQWWW